MLGGFEDAACTVHVMIQQTISAKGKGNMPYSPHAPERNSMPK
jgi:hypothetical protein